MATTEERDIFNNEYVQIYTNGSGNIVLLFQNEVEKTLAIGEKMNEINEEAYMNGYNWDAFFNYYLEENAPDILENLYKEYSYLILNKLEGLPCFGVMIWQPF